MFFKKIKTEVDDDYDDDNWEDDWDDFGEIEDAGFEPVKTETGPREAVTKVAGSFFKGIKDSLLSPNTHKRLLNQVMPDGYVSAYDDVRNLYTSSKGLYDTVKQEAQETHDEYLEQLAPHLIKYDEKKQTKLSNKLAKYASKARRSVPSNQISEEEMAYTAAANEIFGTALQKQSTEAMTNMATTFQESSAIAQHRSEQQTEMMLNQTNALNKSNAFNEQIALKFKQKSLELQFKHYFTSRKQLEINTQQLDYLKATIPDIVKNTGLPDAVKLNLSEQAVNMFKSKIIGNVQDFTSKQFNEYFSQATEKLGTFAKNKLNDFRSQAGMVSDAAGMFEGDDEFSLKPMDLVRDIVFGMAGDWTVNKILDKSKDTLRESVENSNVDYEGKIQQFNALRSTLIPTLKQTLQKGGTGIYWLDDIIRNSELDTLIPDRDTTLQKSLSDRLADQALFDLETKKSITTTIPGLLSEIHGELFAVRQGMGAEALDNDSKLRMDWETGFLNTKGNIKTKLEEKLYGKDGVDRNDQTLFEMFEAMGFDITDIKDTRELKDEQGNVLLDAKDLQEFAKYMKKQSFDNGSVIDTAELANGASGIGDETSRGKIAKLFAETLGVAQGNELLKDAQDPARALFERIKNGDANENKLLSVLNNYKDRFAEGGFENQKYLNSVIQGYQEQLLEMGAVGLATNGSLQFDVSAHVDKMYEPISSRNGPSDTFRGRLNNDYGTQDRTLARGILSVAEQEEKRQEREAKIRVSKTVQKLIDRGVLTKLEAARLAVSKDYSHLADQLTEAEKAAMFPVTAKAGTRKYFEQLAKRKTLKGYVKNELIDVEEAAYLSANPPGSDTSTDTAPSSVLDINVLGEPPRPTDSPTPADVIRTGNQGGSVPPSPSDTDTQGVRWSVVLESYVRRFFDKVFGEFTSSDYLGMAKTVTDGIKQFLTTLAEKGAPTNPTEQAERELYDYLDESKFGGDTGTIANETLTYAIDSILDYIDSKTSRGPENHFFGGTVGGGLGDSISHFRKGGKVKKNRKQKQYLKQINDNKKQIDSAIAKRKFIPAKNTGFTPILNAIQREKQLGGDPQLIVASTGEEILSTANGDAQAFQELKKRRLWEPVKNFVERKSVAKDGDGELTSAIKQLGREVTTNAEANIGEAKKKISETKDKTINKLNEHGTGAALLFRDISIALGNDELKELSSEELKLTETFKKMVTDINSSLKDTLGGGKEAVNEFWNKFKQQCEKEGTSVNKAINRLKDIQGNLKKGKLEPVFKYIDDKRIIARLSEGAQRLKTKVTQSLNLKGLRNEEGKLTLTQTKQWGSERLSATGEALSHTASNVKQKVEELDFDEAKQKLEFELYKLQLRGQQLSGDAKDKAKGFLDKTKSMFYDETGNPLIDVNKFKDIKLPKFSLQNKQVEALATISRQMAELIRTNALIAIGTGSSPDEANPKDPNSILPFTLPTKEGKNVENNKGFFSKIKAKFTKKSKETELDENGNEIDPNTRYAKFKAWMKRKSTAKEIDANEPRLIKRVGNKFVSVKASLGQWLHNRRLTGKALGDNNKQFKDIYLKGQKDPIITGLELSKGLYTKADGQVLQVVDEIEGAILDLSGKVVISQEEFDQGLVYTKKAKGINDKRLFSFGKKGGNSRVKKLFNFFKNSDKEQKDKGGWFSGRSNFFIEATDVYLKGETDPILTRRGFKNNEYFDQDGNVITKTKDITGSVYDKEGNLLVSQKDLDDKNLVLRNGQPIQVKQHGKIRRTLSGMKDVIVGISKPFGLLGRFGKASAKFGLKTLFGASGKTKDIYKVDNLEKPILTSDGFKNGLYFSFDNKPIKNSADIKGSVYDKDGNVLVTEEEYKEQKLVFSNGKPIQNSQRSILRKTVGGMFKATGRGLKNLFTSNKEEDVYLIGEDEPKLYAKYMKQGRYIDQKTRKPITSFNDILNPIIDKETGNVLITQEDIEEQRLLTKSGKKQKSIVSRGIGLLGSITKAPFKTLLAPFKWLANQKSTGVDIENTEFIVKDIYVKESDKPSILSKEVPNNIYFDKDGNVVNKYSQLTNPVYDKNGNVIISEEDIQKGLIHFDGSPIGKGTKGFFRLTGKATGTAFGMVGGLFKGVYGLQKAGLGLIKGAFKFTTSVGKGIFKALGGDSFDLDGRDKYALMIQAQAAAVDKLEAIRFILDKRLENKNKVFNDRDGDGDRDGSYLDQLRGKRDEEKAEAKKKKDAKKKEEAKDKKGVAKEVAGGLMDAFSSPWVKLLGGALLYSFGPQLASALTMGVRSVLPSWLGGLSDERKAQIDKNGGFIATAFKESKKIKAGESTGQKDDPNTAVDESVAQEDQSGTSFWTKALFGLGGLYATGKVTKYLAKRAAKAALTRAGTAIATRVAAGAAASGIAGVAAGGTAAATGTGLAATTAAASGTALAGATAATVAAGTAGTAASGGIMATAGGLLASGLGLLATPVGVAVLGAIAVGGLAYAGYKIYKSLTKKDSHLTEWRMAQYGFKIDDKDHITKILSLEDYLSKHTSKAANSQHARITSSADVNEAFKIFGIASSNQKDTDSFLNWFHYRFKPIYLAWKTVMTRRLGIDNISDVDSQLFKADKIAMVNDVSMGSRGDELYSIMSSPFPGEESVPLKTSAVFDIRDSVLKALDNLKAEDHDNKIQQYGGGKNKTVSSVAEEKRIKNAKETGAATGTATNSISGGTTTNKKPEDKSDNKTTSAPGVGENKQSWLNRLIHGDNATDEGRGVNVVDKITDSVTNFFNSDAKAASGTVDFAKTFTKGLAINGLTEAQTAAMAANTAKTESEFRKGIRNKYGYSGLYQFGGEALAEVGYMKKIGGDWKVQNAAMTNPNNWLNGLSLEKFLSSRELQDKAYVSLVNKNLQYGKNLGGAKFEQLMKDYRQVAKYAKMAHLKGAGNAVKGLLYGKDGKDGNGTSMIKYGNDAAAKVEAILKEMGNGTPVSNAKSDNIAINVGQRAGEYVREKVVGAVAKVKTPASGKAGQTVKPVTKQPTPPPLLAKPTGKPATNNSLTNLVTGNGIFSNKFTGEDDTPSLTSNLIDDGVNLNEKPKQYNSEPFETPVDFGLTNNFTTSNSKPTLLEVVNSTSKGIPGIMNPGVTTTAANGRGPMRNPVLTSTNKSTTQVPYRIGSEPVKNSNNSDYPWMTIARQFLGITREKNPDTVRMFHKEGPAKANWSPSVPWCASFAGYCLIKSGITTNGCTAAAFSFSNYGTDVSADIPYGAIIVWKFSHVSFCAGVEGDKVLSLGGNQSSKDFRNGREVTISKIPKSQIKAVRFPPGYTPGTYNGQGVSNSSSLPGTNGAKTTKYKTNTKLAFATPGGKVNNTTSTGNKTEDNKFVNDLVSGFNPSEKPKQYNPTRFETPIDFSFGNNFSATGSVEPVETKNIVDINAVKDYFGMGNNFSGNNNVTLPVETNTSVKDSGRISSIDVLNKQKQEEQKSVQMQIQQQQARKQTAEQSLDVLKEQLEVQRRMSKDISDMVKLMSGMQKNIAEAIKQQPVQATSSETKPNQQPFQNKYPKTINTNEPVSMKIH